MAVLSKEGFWTLTLVIVDLIMTHSAMLARHRQALVDVLAAVGAGPAWLTLAPEAVDQVSAVATVSAGLHFALVNVDLTVDSHEAWLASTFVVLDEVDAFSAIFTRRVDT